ncbi:MAG: TetR/AcrR family transcriptional regulator [Petrotogaceae bacterium]|jgi:AcrR family transcriptional regulator|nr:TetR/AcrR family transcriptional regulator [Petrotogaceae bacterium]
MVLQAQEQVKKDKKKYLSEKALEMIVENGLSNFTMDDVAKSCGVAKGSLYTYFKNKDALIISAFGNLVERLKKVITYEDIKSTDTAEEKAKYFAKTYSQILSDFPSDQFMRLFEILINSTHDQKMMQDLTEIFTDYYKSLLQVWESLFKSKSKALLFQAMFDGLAMYKAVGVSLPPEEFESTFKEIILKIAK